MMGMDEHLNGGSVRCLIAWNVLRTHSISYQNPLDSGLGIILNCPDRNINHHVYKLISIECLHQNQIAHPAETFQLELLFFFRKEKGDILISPKQKDYTKDIISMTSTNTGITSMTSTNRFQFFHPSLQLPPFPSIFHHFLFWFGGVEDARESPVNHGLPCFTDQTWKVWKFLAPKSDRSYRALWSSNTYYGRLGNFFGEVKMDGLPIPKGRWM